MAFVTVERAFWKFIRCCGERRNVEAIVEVNEKRKEEREKKREENSERVTVLVGDERDRLTKRECTLAIHGAKNKGDWEATESRKKRKRHTRRNIAADGDSDVKNRKNAKKVGESWKSDLRRNEDSHTVDRKRNCREKGDTKRRAREKETERGLERRRREENRE